MQTVETGACVLGITQGQHLYMQIWYQESQGTNETGLGYAYEK